MPPTLKPVEPREPDISQDAESMEAHSEDFIQKILIEDENPDNDEILSLMILSQQ